ncbi:MAG: CBS domain-containing protein [Haliea sp.]
MKVRDAMTSHAEYISPETSLREAAQMMAKLSCGFLPIGNGRGSKLTGVITDRDIAIRGVAEGKDPESTRIGEIQTEKVLYCYADDELEVAADSMRDKAIYRLIVLDTPENKQLCGILSMGDIVRRDQLSLASQAVSGVVKAA